MITTMPLLPEELLLDLVGRTYKQVVPLTPLTDDRYPFIASDRGHRHLIVILYLADDNYRPRTPSNDETVQHFGIQLVHRAKSTIIATLTGPPWRLEWDDGSVTVR